MRPRIVNRSLSFFGLAALTAALVFAAGAGNGLSAQQKDNKKAEAEQKKQAEAQQKKAAAEQKKELKELEALQKKQAQIVKKAEEAVRKQVLEQFKGKESEALKEAYILMAAANHDYNGHRAKSMNALGKAFEALDMYVVKNGTVLDRIKTIRDDQVAAAARFLEKGDTAVHEPQFYSDLQLRQAAVLMEEVKVVMAANKQTKGMHHVDEALKEVGIALKTR